MKRPDDLIVRVILANAKAARAGVVASGIPGGEIDDAFHDTLVFVLERHARGDFARFTDPREARRVLVTFMYRSGRLIGLSHWRKLPRGLCADVPERAVDPLPALEARSELRRLVAASGIYSLIEGDMSLDEWLDGPDVHPATAASRRYRLRHGPGGK